MRTLSILLIVAVTCTGKHLNVHRFLNILNEQEAVESTDKRHEFPKETKRHGYQPETNKQQKLQRTTNVETTYSLDPREDEPFNYEEAFLFPGSHYLLDMIREHCESGRAQKMSVNDIIDHVVIRECDFEDIGNVFSLFGRIRDTDGIVILATRMIIKPMLMSRIKCAASVLDMGLTKLLLAKKIHLISDDENTLYTFLKQMAPMVDPELEPFAEDIAMRGTLEVHEVLFRDTMDFLWKFSLKDLAYGSHHIYWLLKNHFQQVVMENNNSDQLEMHLGSILSGIQCPSGCEVVQSHIQEIQRFKNVFTMTETEHICQNVIDFLTNYINLAIPGHQPAFENNTALEMVCQEIKRVISESVEEYSKYESFLTTTDITDFKLMAEHVFQNEEWVVLEEAINRLGLKDMTGASCFG